MITSPATDVNSFMLATSLSWASGVRDSIFFASCSVWLRSFTALFAWSFIVCAGLEFSWRSQFWTAASNAFRSFVRFEISLIVAVSGLVATVRTGRVVKRKTTRGLSCILTVVVEEVE